MAATISRARTCCADIPLRGHGSAVITRTDGHAVHLPAAALHDSQTVIAQRQVAAKSNEVPAFTPLLEKLDLSGVVVTAEAMVGFALAGRAGARPGRRSETLWSPATATRLRPESRRGSRSGQEEHRPQNGTSTPTHSAFSHRRRHRRKRPRLRGRHPPSGNGRGATPTVTQAWADNGYTTKAVELAAQIRIGLEIVQRDPTTRGFRVQPRRRVIERTLGRLMHHRRLARDHATHPQPVSSHDPTGRHQ
ncbi:transposase [Streptomyces mexicanus]|uniref:Transposase n=1 Tax=Streptomyces mexicanus TaxID=178566 RepID=A0A7X1I2C6_9ACTN|nr:transposase [Streptomyces mexicanus]MBC2866373.1 transposase [Streptomyces mexicanus]